MRAARALLRWRAQDLADKASVGIATIQRAEKEDGPGQMIPSTAAAIRAALEAAGVEFIAENGGGAGVRMRKREGTTAHATPPAHPELRSVGPEAPTE